MSNDNFIEQMDEQCEVAFTLSTERDFIYQYGNNRGHSMTYLKVSRCLFLSAGAKQLYQIICEYAYSGKRECFPSQNMLMLNLGWSRPTLTKFTKELVTSGLIMIHQEAIGNNYVYQITELHQVKVLWHSEVTYKVIAEYKNHPKLLEAVNEYKNSDTFMQCQVQTKETLISEWFSVYMGGDKIEKEDSTEKQQQPVTPAVIHARPPKVDKVEASLDGAKNVSGRKKIDPKNKDVEDWGASDFCQYFEDRYLEVMKLPMMSATLQEKSAMKNVVSRFEGSKHILRKKIDIYIEQEYFSPKGIINFCSQYVQGLIDMYVAKKTFGKAGAASTLTPQVDSKDTEEEMRKLFEANASKLFGGNTS